MATTVDPCGEGQLAAVPGAQRWQYYRHMVQDMKLSDEVVEALGLNGWEMCGAAFTHGFVHLWFKRRV